MTFVEDIGDLVEEVVDDLYLRRFHWVDGRPDFDRAQALRIGRVAIDNPATPIEPRAAGSDTVAGMRRGLAEAVRTELDTRKRRLAVMTYDDLLTRLKKILTDPGGDDRGPAAARALPGRARRRVPGHRPGAVGHRPAGVRRGVDARAHRRPQAGDLRVPRRRRLRVPRGRAVGRRERHARGQLAQRPGPAGGLRRAVRQRAARPRGDRLPLRARRRAPTARRGCSARRIPSRCGCASCTATTRRSRRPATATRATTPRAATSRATSPAISSGCSPPARGSSAAPRTARCSGRTPVRPGHVAVLVRTHRQAALVRDALDAVEIPAVINGAGSVFGSEPGARLAAAAGGDRAPERARPRPRRRADAVPRLGRRAGRGRRGGGVGGGPPAPARVGARAARDAASRRCWRRITLVEGLPGRLLSAPGRRAAPDRPAPRRPAAARGGRRRAARRDRADRLAAPADRGRRAGDGRRGAQPPAGVRRRGRAGAHDPPLARASSSRSSTSPTCGSRPGSGARRSPCSSTTRPTATRARSTSGSTGRTSPRHVQQHMVEARGEDLRLAYVALTRARHQAVVWWAGSANARDSALSRLLFARARGRHRRRRRGRRRRATSRP